MMRRVHGPAPIDSLTSLRGLAALWIVLYHYWSELLVLVPQLNWFSPAIRAGHFAVPLFFILSGFVLAFNYRHRFYILTWHEYFRFVTLRFARIYPVHLISLLIVLFLVGVARLASVPVTDGGYTATTFFENIFLVQTWVPNFALSWNYPSWSISSEWFAYLWFPILSTAVLRRIHSALGATSLLGLAWLSSIVVYAAGPIQFRELLVVIPTFIAGALTCTSWEQARHVPYSLRWLPEACAAMIVTAPFILSGVMLIAAFLALFIVLIWTLSALGDACTGFWRWRYMIFLGEASYSLYMTHTLAQKICHAMLPASRFQDGPMAFRLAVMCLYGLGVGAACLTMYWLVERPAREYIRNRLDGRGRVGTAAATPTASSTGAVPLPG